MDKKPEECKGGAPEWMTTYGDLVTLLMCFFVLLFAFSEIDAQKFDAVMQSFQGSAGVLEGGKTLSESPLVFDGNPENSKSPETVDVEKIQKIKETLQEMMEKLSEEVEGKKVEDLVEFKLEDNRLLIRLKDSVLFDPGDADIKEASLGILKTIGEVLNGEMFKGSDIKIEGHTDNVPIKTVRFPSNWELSAGRATSVLRYFRDTLGMSENRLSISGYADMKPIGDNNTKEGRSLNRRVEIIVENINIDENVKDEKE